jgi:hypothetical protein
MWSCVAGDVQCTICPTKLMSRQQKTRLGRPPLPPGDTRCKRVVTFVTRSEMEHLQNLSAENRSTLSSICHRILAEYLNQSPDVGIESNRSKT